jgi:site-specific DNA-methyltransferase (adenine-specific)
MNKLNIIYNEDSIIGLNKIKDKSIDMILADLPYETTQNHWDTLIPLNNFIEIKIKNKLKKLNYTEFLVYEFKKNKNYNETKEFWEKNKKIGLWTHYNRVLKENGVVVLTSQNKFTRILLESNKKYFRYSLVWEKTKAGGFLNAKRMPLQAHEDILIFYKKLPTYNPQMMEGKPYTKTAKTNGDGKSYGKFDRVGKKVVNNGKRFPRSIIKISNDNHNSLHSTQKPIELFEWLIKTYSNKNDIILDNTIGSGTTAIAALKNERYFIGFEKDKKIFDICIKRIKEYKKN